MSRGERPIAEIAPDDFLSVWGASSYEEALKKAERAKTTTPTSERKRCPECRSQRVRRLSDKTRAKQQRKTDHDYLCTTCRHRFDSPVFGEEPARQPTSDGEESADPFEWVSGDDLEDPPVRRVTQQLEELDDLALGILAVRLYAPWDDDDGPSYREISEVLPYSRQWVGERVRAWKNDDYFGGDR